MQTAGSGYAEVNGNSSLYDKPENNPIVQNGTPLPNENRGRILIVDAHQDLHQKILDLFADTGYQVQATAGTELVKQIEKRSYELVLLDLSRSQLTRDAIVDQILKAKPWLSIVIVTNEGSLEIWPEAVKKRVYSCLTHPVVPETLDLALRGGVERSRLLAENTALRQKLLSDDLTLAYNRGYLETYLDEELERASPCLPLFDPSGMRDPHKHWV